MMSFITNQIILIPLVSICVMVIVYIWADPVIDFLKERSLGQKDEIIRYFKLMAVEVDEKRITLLMLLMSFGLGAVFFILFWPNIIIGLLFGVTVTICGWSVPLLIIRNLYEKRCDTFTDQMVDGLTIMAMVYAFGHISGAHFNPAVTISMMVAKKICSKTGVLYIIAQLLGLTRARRS